MLRNLLIQLFLLVYSSFWVRAQIPEKGLLCHFSFDNKLHNAVDKTHQAKLIGAQYGADRFNRPLHAIKLNGEQQYVSLGNSKRLKPTEGLTLALWASKDNWQGKSGAHIFSNYEFAGFALALKNIAQLSATLKTTDGSLDVTYSISALSPGWHHFAVTFDGQHFVLYVDSQPVARSKTSEVATIEQHPTNHTFLGVSASREHVPWYYEQNYFQGMIDDVFVYGRALSEQEIIYLYEDAPPVEMKGFVFDRETGKKIAAQIDIDGVMYTATAEKGYTAPIKPKASDKIIHISAKGYFGKVDRIPKGVYYFEQNFELNPIKINESVVLNNIEFEQNSSELSASSFVYLDSVVEMMKENSTIKIEISGHTDIIGNPKANQALSEKRAESVSKYLISKGINSERIKTVGYGGALPIVTSQDEELRKKNRRVEFKVTSY